MADDDRKGLFVRLPPDLHAALQRLAEVERRSLSAQVEVMLAEMVNVRTKEDG